MKAGLRGVTSQYHMRVCLSLSMQMRSSLSVPFTLHPRLLVLDGVRHPVQSSSLAQSLKILKNRGRQQAGHRAAHPSLEMRIYTLMLLTSCVKVDETVVGQFREPKNDEKSSRQPPARQAGKTRSPEHEQEGSKQATDNGYAHKTGYHLVEQRHLRPLLCSPG